VATYSYDDVVVVNQGDGGEVNGVDDTYYQGEVVDIAVKNLKNKLVNEKGNIGGLYHPNLVVIMYEGYSIAPLIDSFDHK
jgi:hypothetical protein